MGLGDTIENVNPQRFLKQSLREITDQEKDDDVEDDIDEREIFGMSWSLINFKYINDLLNDFL